MGIEASGLSLTCKKYSNLSYFPNDASTAMKDDHIVDPSGGMLSLGPQSEIPIPFISPILHVVSSTRTPLRLGTANLERLLRTRLFEAM